MTVCDPTVSNREYEGTRTVSDSTSVTNSTDTGSDTSMSLDKNSDDLTTCHDIRASIRRSPRSLNKKSRNNRNAIKMQTGTFESCKYSSPHIHLNNATINIITKKEEKLVDDDGKIAKERKSLEDQIVAVTLVKSVVESTEQQQKKVDIATEVSVNTNTTGGYINNNSTSESRVGVTLSCNNAPATTNKSSNFLNVEENNNLEGNPNVGEDRDEKKGDPNFSGVYCGTRKRKRDAFHPDSPLSMEEYPTLHKEAKALSPCHNDNNSRTLVQENKNSGFDKKNVNPLEVVTNLQRPTAVLNSSVPNPILGSSSPLNIESDRRGSTMGTADNIMRQNCMSDPKDVISRGNGDSEEVINSVYSNINSCTIPSIKVENPTASNIATESVSSQYSLPSASITPRNAMLTVTQPEPCPVERREQDSVEKVLKNSSSMTSVLRPSNENDNETQPSSRRRIFSIDFDSNVFDFDTGLGNSTQPNGYLDNQSLPHLGAKLDPNSTINRAAHVIDEIHDRGPRENLRDRGMSFELFSFGLTADEPLPPTQGLYNGEVSKGWRIGESNIFDPVSFTDGGIHEEKALSKSRPISMIQEDIDELDIMNTPGFVEGPVPHCHLQQSVPNPVFSHPGENRLPNAISESSSIGMRNDLQFNHNTANTANTEVPLKTYSSTAMKLNTMSNVENDFFSSQENQVTSLLAQVLPCTMNGTVSHSSCAMELLNKGGRIGIYLPVARKERIAKFHSKRKMRIWRKRIKYDCRKKLADSRPRIKGRFVKSLEQDD